MENYRKLLTNIYFLSKYHKDLNFFIMNDLMRDDREREYARGLFEAYSAIVQMVEQNDSIGRTSYQRIHKMEGTLPYIYT